MMKTRSTSVRGMPIQDLAQHRAPFVTVRALANYWGVDISTVYRDIRKGALPVFRLPGGAVRVRTEDALKYGEPIA